MEQKLRVNLLVDYDKFVGGLRKAEGSLKSFGNRASKIGKKLSVSLTLPIGLAGAAAVNAASDFEKLRTQLNVLTGSAENGAKAFERLVQFSAKTPFQLNDLVRVNNMLIGFGLSTDEAYDSLKLLGDIAAVSGGDLNGIAIAFGQAAASGRLMSQDINQLINNQVPAIKLLADELGVATGEVKNLASEGKIGFEDLRNALIKATSAGGMFENGMQKLSTTFAGQLSTFRDNLNIALADFGKIILPILSDLLKKLTTLLGVFKSLTPQTKKLILTLAGITAVIPPIMYLAGTAIPALVSALAFLAANPAVALLGALGAIALSIHGTINNLDNLKTSLKANSDEVNRLKEEQVKLKKEALDGNIDATKKLYQNYINLAQAEKNRLIILKKTAERQNISQAALDGYDSKIKEHQQTIDLYTKGLSNLEVNQKKVNKAIEKGTESIGRTPVKALSVGTVKDLIPFDDLKPTAANNITKPLQEVGSKVVQINEEIGENISNGFSTMVEGIASGTMSVGQVFGGLMNILGDVAVQIGKAALKIGVGMLAIKESFKNPATAIAAGIALIAMGAVIKGFGANFSSGVTAFANGGIVSSPTLGLMGEYSGARSNPEVIAPLDKLKSMIGDRSQNVNVGGEFRIQGQDLVLALQRADKQRNRIT